MSSRRWRSGGTVSLGDAEPVVQVLRETGLRLAGACRSILLAAMARKSTAMLRFDPSRSTCRSCSTRSSLPWVAERHAVDLVEKQRAALRMLDLAGPALRRAGEGAALVAEEFAFRHGVGHRGAVDRHIVARAAPAEIVQAARDQILADAGLAVDHHAGIGCGQFGDLRAQRFGGARIADDARRERWVR